MPEEHARDGARESFGLHALLALDGPGVPERREPVHERPCREAVRAVVARLGRGARAQHISGSVHRGGELGVVASEQVGPEHHLEPPGLGGGEPHIGHAGLDEVVPGGLEGGGEPVEPVGRDGGEEALAVAEVMGGGGVGDADAAGQVAQAEPGDTLLLDRGDRRLDQALA